MMANFIVSQFQADIDDLLSAETFGKLDFSNLFLVLGSVPAGTGTTLDALKKAGVPVFAYGNFITVAVNFAILAFIIFLMVKQINRIKRETPAAAPAPVAPPKPAPNRGDLRVACPTQVAPEMPRKAIQDGSEGVVRAQALVKDGAVKEVTILSGPRVFHAAVKAAMMQYKCTQDATEILATQEFVFKIE